MLWARIPSPPFLTPLRAVRGNARCPNIGAGTLSQSALRGHECKGDVSTSLTKPTPSRTLVLLFCKCGTYFTVPVAYALGVWTELGTLEGIQISGNRPSTSSSNSKPASRRSCFCFRVSLARTWPDVLPDTRCLTHLDLLRPEPFPWETERSTRVIVRPTSL